MITTDGGSERVIRPGGGAYAPCGWVGNDRIVICQDGANLTLVDTMGVERDRIVVPDSIAMTNTPRIDATSGLAAYWSSRAGALMVVDFKTKRFARALPSAAELVVVGWGSAGDIYVQRAITVVGDEGRRQTLELGRISRGTSTIVPVTPIPAECRMVVVGAGGRRAVCSSRRYSADVWLADAPGKSGW